MKILFIHRDFPGQFMHLARVLAMNSSNLVLFITSNEDIPGEGINKLVYKKPDKNSIPGSAYLKEYSEAVAHGQAAANIAAAMKKKGIIPDIIYAHSWGSSMFMKDIFPDVPLLCYFEWFDNADGAAIGFDGNIPNLDYRETIRSNTPYKLIDLYSCDAGISPTEWQKSQFPKEFHHKIKVIHDGVNTDICKPDENAKCKVQSVKYHCDERKIQKREFTAKDEVITYATRGMEPMRGFVQFMEAVEILLKKRPNAHFVVAGKDKVCYGEPLKKGTYKELMLKKLNVNSNRVHFVEALDFDEYIRLLQISSVHFYSTYPFVLSWSLMEAMSTGCCIVASNTPPVTEMIKDNYNGLLFDFFNVNQIVEKIEYALDNKKEMQKIRENARKTIVENYSLKVLMPKQLEYIINLIKRNNERKQ
jgi:glycosyltransferase involved in cell wall biosynthesis